MKMRKVVISTFVALISLATLSLSASVAWFASSSRAYVDSIDIQMKATRDLRISTTPDVGVPEEYTVNELTSDDLIETRLFAPVSSMFQSKWFNPTASEENRVDEPKFYDYLTPLTIDEKPREEEVSNKVYNDNHELQNYQNRYYSQDLYFICDDDVTVSIDPETTFIKANEEENKKTAHDLFITNDVEFRGYEEDEIYTCLNKLANAMRISILVNNGDDYNYYIYNPNKIRDDQTYETLLGGRLDIDKDRYYDTFSRGADRYETIYGEVLNDSRFSDDYYNDVGTAPALPDDTKYSAFVANTQTNAHPFSIEKATTNGLNIKEEGAFDNTNVDDMDNGIKIPVYRNVPSKFVLSIYLEGWDLDCINTTMGAKFLAQIQFKIQKEM